MGKDYYVGLDMGTGSLGWAVTNCDYELIRAHGKALWGVRLFKSAETAEKRREQRTNRRRLDRMQWRIQLLQGLFAPEINKVDPGFYLRMKESRYVPEDKRDANGKCPELPYALFVDGNFTDKDYYKKFPTIYHLRKWLMETSETPDIRLIYLAIHHMVKHRGHFLLPGEIDEVKEFDSTFNHLIQTIHDEELEFNLTIDQSNLKLIAEILKNKKISKFAKTSQLIKELNAKEPCEKAVLNLIVGRSVKLSDIFEDKDLNDTERPRLSFSDNSFDEYINLIESELDERFAIIEAAKAVYDWAVLEEILGSHKTLSEAKVAQYDKHNKDLQYLKKLVKENLTKEDYNKIFVSVEDKLDNYSAYVGGAKRNGKKISLEGKTCRKDDFYKFLKKNVVEKINDSSKTSYLETEMETGGFLPKQVTNDNGVIPYQIHLYELDKILKNLSAKIPLVASEKEKIRSIFTFRIPYYVGPLNGVQRGDKKTNWLERRPEKEHEKIYPWNFDEVVDKEKSAHEFIGRMTNKCTYLLKEDVLPKSSLLYSKFVVLNELNNVRLDGEPISVELKQKIYNELFKRYRKVTQKKLHTYLLREGITDENAEITGIDGDFKGSLTAYHDFKEKLTDCPLGEMEMESIIFNITLFGDEKKLLKDRLHVLYPQLTDKQVSALSRISYKGWGRLSRRFLEEITAPAVDTGEAWTVIRAMWETNDNLMQVLSEKYKFADAIEYENQGDTAEDFSYKLVKEYPVSPAVKRQIWQTLLVIKELQKVMGEAPKRVFIEMARESGEKKRTVSRKQTLIDLYKKCKQEEREWISELTDTKDHQLRSDKLFLYYTQKGRCMYSGDVIELQDLWTSKYDIDHIYPQSKVMDDSISNRVLCKKECNLDKGDEYPIKYDIIKARKAFWKSLEEDEFISKEKYRRLTRNTKFEPAELAGFIARQLVETRQSTKAVATILKEILPDTEIVYAKAKTTSKFRQDFDLIKVREMNDLHHAKDAYLNIVVGNAYYTKFTANASWYIKKYPGRSYNLKEMFTSGRDIKRNGEIAWKAGDAGTIVTVKKVMSKNNILVTRRSYEAKGGLFKNLPVKKGKGQVPIKGSDTRLADIAKYGGYISATGTYFMLVESDDKKGNRIRTIVHVPLYLSKKIESDPEVAQAYLIEDRGLVNPQIRLSKIKIDTLFKVDGFPMWISGRTGVQLKFKGGVQLILSKDNQVTLKKVLKFVQRRKQNREMKIEEYDEISANALLELYNTFIDKLERTVYQVRLGAQADKLRKVKEKFLSLTLEDQCLVLSEILHLFQCQSTSANLKLIGGGGEAGGILLHSNITQCKQISIVNQSPTGIYEQEIDLKTV